MPTLTQTARDFSFIVSESNGYLSRDEVTITTASADWAAGTVLTLVGGDYRVYDGDSTVAAEKDAVGILCEAIGTGETAKRTIINKDAEVSEADLVTTTATGLAASLADLGIKVR